MISFEHVSKRYGQGAAAVGDLSLEVADGELVVLVGPSGCGKTTTLRMINRLIEPSAGRILIDGEDVLGQDPVRDASGHRLRHPTGWASSPTAASSTTSPWCPGCSDGTGPG